MAKKAKPAQEIVLTDEQKNIAQQFESEVEKSTTYKSAASVVNKLKNSKEKLSKAELDTLLNFYKNENFSSAERESLELNKVQQTNLVTNIAKLKSPELGVNFATQDFMIETQNPSLTKVIEKDANASVEYATEYYKHNVGAEDVRWCFDLVLNNVRKDLVGKKPKDESYSQIAKFIYETQPVAMYEGDTELRTELYNAYIEGSFADKIFGSDEQIARIPNQKKKAALISKKENFMKKVREAIVEEHDATKLAEVEADEVEDNIELESDEKMKAYIQNLTNKKFREKYVEEMKTTQKFMDNIKKRHPNDYDEYLNKLRQSKAYKKAFEKYSKMYTEARESLKAEAITEIKEEIRKESQQQVLNEDNKIEENVEEPAKENQEEAKQTVEQTEKQTEDKVENKPEEKIEQKPEEKAEAKPKEKTEEELKEQEENSKEPEVLEAEVIAPEQQKEMEKENAKEESKESPKVEEKAETKDEEELCM